MKFNLDIEIDWIDEDSNLDETVKTDVIQKVVLKLENVIKEQTELLILDKVERLVDKRVTKTYDEFLNNEIAITDNYGDIKETYSSLKDLIKKRFDDFMNQMVDERGNTSMDRYGKMQRINYLIDKQLKEETRKFTEDALKTIHAEIESVLTEKMKNKMGSKLYDIMEINKLLEENNK